MLTFSIVFTFLFAPLHGQEDELKSRILYGQKADIQEFPYFAALVNCNAVIISESWLVTAAHCVAVAETKYGQVWLGGDFMGTSEPPKFYDAVVIHPDFDIGDRLFTNDIALLRLAVPLNFSAEVQAVALPQPQVHEYMTPETYSGIQEAVPGRDAHQGGLVKMEVTGLRLEECVSHFSLWERIYLYRYRHMLEDIICTKRHSYNDYNMPGLSQRNSGSPLVQYDTLVGLAVTVVGDIRTSSIVTFIKIARHTEWIRFITGIKTGYEPAPDRW